VAGGETIPSSREREKGETGGRSRLDLINPGCISLCSTTPGSNIIKVRERAVAAMGVHRPDITPLIQDAK
jgi:hypothetical protein